MAIAFVVAFWLIFATLAAIVLVPLAPKSLRVFPHATPAESPVVDQPVLT
jgi:hypothetical protein